MLWEILSAISLFCLLLSSQFFDLLLANRVDPVSKAVIYSQLDHSDHKVIEFNNSLDRRKRRKTSASGHKEGRLQVALGISKCGPLGKCFCRCVEVHWCWSLFKHHFLRAQKKAIPKFWKSCRWGRGLAQLNRILLLEIRWIRKVHAQWKQGQVTWDKYRDTTDDTSGRKVI